jgi:hypothetical protein
LFSKTQHCTSLKEGIMTRSYQDYENIQTLWGQGLNKKQISRMTYIPRRTVIDCIQRFGSLEGLQEQQKQVNELWVLTKLINSEEETSQIHSAYAYLLGIYLGDGNIVKVRNVYRLRVTLDARYPGIIEHCSEKIRMVLPENEIGIVEHYYKGHLSCVDVSCYYKDWPSLFPQHGDGKKHDRPIILRDWQQRIIETYPLEFFRGLFHSDGSRFSNVVNGKDYPRYQFTNMAKDILRMFGETCDRLNLHWTMKVRAFRAEKQATDIYISRREDMAFLDQHIGPKR